MKCWRDLIKAMPADRQERIREATRAVMDEHDSTLRKLADDQTLTAGDRP